MTPITASLPVYLGIPGLATIVLLLLVLGVARAERTLGSAARASRRALLTALCAAAWFAFTLLAAHSGVLGHFQARPPPLLVLLVLSAIGTVVLARSSFGERLARGLPLAALVGFQVFRFPLELLLHRAARDGALPIEMSFSGYNFDIVSGVSAGLLGLLLVYRPASPRLVLLWNVVGSLLLCNIVIIAIAATPVFHAFGYAHLNVLITQAPFVLLPSVLVMAALFGHMLVFRKLRHLSRLPLSAVDTGSADRHRLGTASLDP
jgi:hypothetical protein